MLRLRRAIVWSALLAAVSFLRSQEAAALDPAGAQLYQRYCASCHGLTGTGDGPVAPDLRVPPPDLTTIAQRAGGRFDEADVIAVIDGRRTVKTHGPREMPVWGAVFDEELQGKPYPQFTVLLRAKVLAEYLESIQKK